MTESLPPWVDLDGVRSILADAYEGFETSLGELAFRATLDDAPILEVLTWLDHRLRSAAVEVRPPIGDGEFLQPRLVVVRDRMVVSHLDLIARGEDHNQEFKSSLYFDRKLAIEDPAATDLELRSEHVFDAVLKTIGAFANSAGGDLWIGIADDQGCPGIGDDMRILSFDSNDRLELHLRDRIGSRFDGGDRVNDYVGVSFVELEGQPVMRAQVERRGRLSFVKLSTGSLRAFRRQGNRTKALEVTDIEEYVLRRSRDN